MSTYATIRSLENGDWDLNTVAKGNEAIKLLIATGLLEIVGTYDFNLSAGVDLRNLTNTADDNSALINNIQRIILETAGVVEAEILVDEISISSKRVISIPFTFSTIEGVDDQDVFITQLA